MKLKILLYFLLTSTLIYGQKLKTAEILGETYGISYSKSDEMFTMCEKVSDLNKSCNQVRIDDENVFQFQDKLRKTLNVNRDSYKYNFFGSEKTIAQFSTIDFKTLKFDLDTNKLVTLNNEVSFQFDDSPDQLNFKIKQASNTNFEVNCDKVFMSPLKFSYSQDLVANKANFIDEIKKQIEVNKKTEVIGFYTEMVKTKFLKLLQELYNTTITKDTDYKFLTAQELNNSSSPPEARYKFFVLIDAKTFHIKVCDDTDKCYNFNDFDNDISEAEFINNLIKTHGLFTDNDKLNEAGLGKVYLLARSKINAKKVQANKREFNDSLKDVITQLENEGKTYSGQFVLNNLVDLYEYKDVKVDRKNMFGNKKTNDDGSVKQKTVSKFVLNDKLKLGVDSINIHIFNNRADNITIVGKLSDNDNKTQVFTNRFYSLPLREFNHRKQLNSIVTNDKTYYYYYDDVLDYLPYNKYNYAAKNAEYKVKKDDTTRVVERKIGDYFTGIFFTDILGLNSSNGNSLIIAEGRLRIPWHLRNWGKYTVFDNISLYASVALVGGLENSSRKVRIDNFTNPDLAADENADKLIADNFNLLDLNNVDAGINLTAFTFEWKGASTFMHLRYGLRFLRTGVVYNLNEVTTMPDPNDSNNTITEETLLETREFQVYSIGQEAEIHFEFRPQALIGGDLTAGLNWFGPTGTNQSDVDFNTTNNTPNLKLLANVYAYTDSENSNSGVYVRFGGHYNLGNSRLFPQLLVGYATNLSSFVNKLTKD